MKAACRRSIPSGDSFRIYRLRDGSALKLLPE